MTKNIPFFLTNYLMVFVLFTLLTLLTAPLMAILVSLPMLCYWYLFSWRADAEIKVPVLGYPGRMGGGGGGSLALTLLSVGDREKYVAVGVVAVLVFLLAASDLIWLVGVTAVFVGAHSVFYASQDEWELATAFDSDMPV